jgi:acyl-CoA reductase-like NAD-dependent aldehyde dehydrogenase
MVGIFFNQGQVCSATSRLLVQEGIKDKLIARLVEEAKKIKLGSGFDEEAKMGPIVSEGQYHRVLSYIKRGQDEGKTKFDWQKKDTSRGPLIKIIMNWHYLGSAETYYMRGITAMYLLIDL